MYEELFEKPARKKRKLQNKKVTAKEVANKVQNEGIKAPFVEIRKKTELELRIEQSDELPIVVGESYLIRSLYI